ncbi:CBS domain-containing protein [Mariprofundus sp. EBB-1]|uniref:CBS domain-containing protein n=1 Tax=Mariprofundus sp. EBB-1 TaxID=2650971 RepID=UPI000EF273E4|nr:CBS domain-containing protein [Mariprofundus sp. EBB-1]RLL51540.1 CBS domain-containing protein [Mariprofundus sp. EBB-1]
MFTVYGPGATDPIPLERLFVRPAVTKPAAISAMQGIKAKTNSNVHTGSESHSAAGLQQYHSAETISEKNPSLKAVQIMTTSVVYVLSSASVAVALKELESSQFRHIPVLSDEYQLVGMISDRDIVRCMCGSGNVCVHCAKDKQEITVETIMKGNVLSASVDTDARYIARLFVEQRIGAMPITDEGQLVGMITRSDILKAVMVHFDLNLWS